MKFIFIGNYSFNVSDISIFYENVKHQYEDGSQEVETVIVMKNGLSYNIKGRFFNSIKLQLDVI